MSSLSKIFITGNFGIQCFEFPNFYFPAIEVIQNGNSTNCLKSSNNESLRHFEVSRPLGILHYGPPQSARPLQGPKKLQPSFVCIVFVSNKIAFSVITFKWCRGRWIYQYLMYCSLLVQLKLLLANCQWPSQIPSRFILDLKNIFSNLRDI